jgi:hypothetical protein
MFCRILVFNLILRNNLFKLNPFYKKHSDKPYQNQVYYKLGVPSKYKKHANIRKIY